MRIAGIQKLTLLDYPGTVACTLFTVGCNFRCPFCQNASLVLPGLREELIPTEEVLRFLQGRFGILDGVAITGGEPMLQADIVDFLSEIKKIGYRVKLDTNGADPDGLQLLIERGLIDRVAVDIKSSRENYASAIGLADAPVDRIDRTRELLMTGTLPFELRTTVVQGIHTDEEIRRIAEWIAGDEEYYLQQYRDSGEIMNPTGLSSPSEVKMQHFADIVRPFVPRVQIRGI